MRSGHGAPGGADRDAGRRTPVSRTFARFALQFTHAMRDRFRSVRGFVLIGGMDEVADLLRSSGEGHRDGRVSAGPVLPRAFSSAMERSQRGVVLGRGGELNRVEEVDDEVPVPQEGALGRGGGPAGHEQHGGLVLDVPGGTATNAGERPPGGQSDAGSGLADLSTMTRPSTASGPAPATTQSTSSPLPESS